MVVAVMTAEEIVATLQKSSLPTVLVEGSDDLTVYRWIEDQLGTLNANMLPCGGRSILLVVYARRDEFSGLKTAFVADRDMWYFTAIPAGYPDIIWTDGYSVENDVYEPSNIETYLTALESLEFDMLLGELVRWFAFEVEEHRAGREARVATHPSRIIPPGQSSLCQRFVDKRGFSEPSSATVAEVTANYKLAVRGKLLFQLLVRFLSATNRTPKYSHAATVDVALRSTLNNPRLARIINEIRAALN
jgi:hypothetical protein